MNRVLAIGATLLLVPAMLLAQPAPPAQPARSFDAAAAFGARQNVESVSLSPDGRRIAYTIPWRGQGSRLYTLEIGSTQPRAVVSVDGRDQRLWDCDWVSNARLVCTMFAITETTGRLMAATRLIALNADGSNVRMLGQRSTMDQIYNRFWGGNVIDWLAGQENQVLMEQSFIPESRPGSLLARDEEGVGVVQVDTATLRTRRVEAPQLSSFRFLTDGRGRIRIKGVQSIRDYVEGAVVTHFYRPVDSDEWRRIGDHNILTREGRWPVAVDAERNAAYILERVDGRRILYRMALDGTGGAI
ncbi:MAG: hypothetical protein ACT4OE_02105 [Sphingosinicella sp.]